MVSAEGSASKEGGEREMVRRLKTIRMNDKEYFIDERLSEIRNVRDPFDVESVSREVLEYWKDNDITEV